GFPGRGAHAPEGFGGLGPHLVILVLQRGGQQGHGVFRLERAQRFGGLPPRPRARVLEGMAPRLGRFPFEEWLTLAAARERERGAGDRQIFHAAGSSLRADRWGAPRPAAAAARAGGTGGCDGHAPA